MALLPPTHSPGAYLLDCVCIWEGLHCLLPVTVFLALCGVVTVAELRCKVNVSVPFRRHRKHWAAGLGAHQPRAVSATWGHCLRDLGCERGLAGVRGCAALLLLFWKVGEQDQLAGPRQDEEEALRDLALLHQERPLLVCALFHIGHGGLHLRMEQHTCEQSMMRSHFQAVRPTALPQTAAQGIATCVSGH
jgi:hypothetical protein